MKYNWTQELSDMDGEAVPETKTTRSGLVIKTRTVDGKEEPVPLMLGRACIKALLSEGENERLSPEQRFEGVKLAMQSANEPEKSLTAEEVSFLKARVGFYYYAYLLGTIWVMLEVGE